MARDGKDRNTRDVRNLRGGARYKRALSISMKQERVEMSDRPFLIKGLRLHVRRSERRPPAEAVADHSDVAGRAELVEQKANIGNAAVDDRLPPRTLLVLALARRTPQLGRDSFRMVHRCNDVAVTAKVFA